jgi:TetR/AcrR family transcriptional regulator, transcriptional repressor for nem operon
MARPREFEIEEALQDAMGVFWEKGYDGASLPELLDGMGIARGSLYKAYGDKKSLFLKALSLYDREVLQPAIALLRGQVKTTETPPVNQLFMSVVEAARQGDRRGCLMCNAAAGPAAKDKEIGRAVAGMLTRLTKAFAVALELAGVADRRPQLAQQAQALTTAYVGLRVLARSGASVSSLEQSVAGVIAAR